MPAYTHVPVDTMAAGTNIWTIYANGSAKMESLIFVGVDGQQTAMGPRVFTITSTTSANARMGDLFARDGRGRQRHENSISTERLKGFY